MPGTGSGRPAGPPLRDNKRMRMYQNKEWAICDRPNPFHKQMIMRMDAGEAEPAPMGDEETVVAALLF